MKIIICDDEPKYRALLHERILQDSFACDYEVEITEYEGGESLLQALETGVSADVYFLDIQMENGTDDGIRVARKLRSMGDAGLIVYVTSFIDYVQTGYEVKAFRYLLKSQIGDGLAKVLADIRQELNGDESFCFQAKGETIRVNCKEILYLESDRRTVRLVTEKEESVYYGKLEEAEKALGDGFLRCHRSFLVNMAQIKKYSGEGIVIQDGQIIPISRTYAGDVKRKLMLEMKL